MEYQPPVGMISSAQIEWTRTLPMPGQVFARVGDRVEAMDIVARGLEPGPVVAVNAARLLGIGLTALPRYMVKREGERVKERDVLAARGGIFGLFRRKCLSPVAGTILAVAQGRILLEQEPSTVELRAYARGEVIQVVPNRGVVIRTTGALIRGAWSSGKEAYGILRVVVEEPDEPLTADLVDASWHGAIVVGGSIIQAETLKQAAELSVRAIVAGSMDAASRKLAVSLPFPVVITEGFGDLVMAEPIFRLLHRHQGREAVVVQRANSLGASFPEIFVSLPAEQDKIVETPLFAPLAEGSRVHLLRPPYMGLTGQVASAPSMIRDAGTSLSFWGVRIQLDDGRMVGVPITNLELLQ